METQSTTENPFDTPSAANEGVQQTTSPATEVVTETVAAKSQYHAVIVQGGSVRVISHAQKNKVIKELEALDDYTIVQIFKGKIIQAKEKTTLELM